MKKLTSFVLYLILTLCPVMAQGFRLSGQITDTSGEPVPGATVMITGTDIGTMADADGKFILDVKSGLSPEATLTLSSLGFKDLVVLVGKKTVFNVTLEEENNVLEETVVIGYSTVKKKDLTGSLTSVEGDAVRTRQTATVSEALQGAMPGVTVTRSSSAPGGEATIRVRGITSMTSGATDPYVLIDGVPGAISDVNPGDIENITVLKDAASASIYGSQAAAGVILITTKRAKENGRASVSYNYSLGVDSPTKMPEYMDAVSYMEACNELKYNDLPESGWYQAYDKDLVGNYKSLHAADPDTYPVTDWMNLILKKNAIRHSHNLKLTVSGTGSARRSASVSTMWTVFTRRTRDGSATPQGSTTT